MPRRRADDFLHNLDDDFLDCRTLGHVNQEVGNRMNGQEVHFVLQCQRCDSYFIVQWSKSLGTINSRRAKYTPGYLNKTGQHITRADARIERMRRTKFGTVKEFEKLLDTIDKEMESYR